MPKKRFHHDGFFAISASARDEPQRLQNLLFGLFPVPHWVQIRSPGLIAGSSSRTAAGRLRCTSSPGFWAAGARAAVSCPPPPRGSAGRRARAPGGGGGGGGRRRGGARGGGGGPPRRPP